MERCMESGRERKQEEKHMFKVNDNYLKLPGSYLFSTIGKKVNAYAQAHPDKKIIRLGIGDEIGRAHV